MLKLEIISGNRENDNDELKPVSSDEIEIEDNEDQFNEESSDFVHKLNHNLAGIFLKMQSILHIPASSIQDVIQELTEIHKLSFPLIYKSVSIVLRKHYPDVDDSLVTEVVHAVSESNVFSKCCDKGRCLSTVKKKQLICVKHSLCYKQCSTINFG